MTNEEIEQEAASLAQMADIAMPNDLTRAQRAAMQKLVADGIKFGLRKFVAKAYEEVLPYAVHKNTCAAEKWDRGAGDWGKCDCGFDALKTSLTEQPPSS